MKLIHCDILMKTRSKFCTYLQEPGYFNILVAASWFQDPNFKIQFCFWSNQTGLGITVIRCVLGVKTEINIVINAVTLPQPQRQQQGIVTKIPVLTRNLFCFFVARITIVTSRNALWNRLWRHQQDVDRTSGTRNWCLNIVLSSFIGSLCQIRK